MRLNILLIFVFLVSCKTFDTEREIASFADSNKNSEQLSKAIDREDIGTIKSLLNTKAVDPNYTDKDGNNLVMKATLKKSSQILSLLLDSFGNSEVLNQKNNSGNTALHLAVKASKNANIVKLLTSQRGHYC